MSFDLQKLTSLLAQHGRVARVVVVVTKGSTPREIGASMLVWDGGQFGTIGGGALEFEAAKTALDGTKTQTIPLGPARGQCCGGSVTLVTEVFEQPPAAEAFYVRQISGLDEKPLRLRHQEAAARRGDPARLVYENGWLGEPVEPAKTPMWIYGAGHVGRAMVGVLSALPNYETTWIDTDQSRFPDMIPQGVTPLIAAQPSVVVKHAPVNTLHYVLTYSHALDLELCHQILSHGFGGAGLIGSKTKWARFRKRLKELGHSESQISRIECPIGNPSFGKHPQEIAVSVASSLLSRRNGESMGKDCAN